MDLFAPRWASCAGFLLTQQPNVNSMFVYYLSLLHIVRVYQKPGFISPEQILLSRRCEINTVRFIAPEMALLLGDFLEVGCGGVWEICGLVAGPKCVLMRENFYVNWKLGCFGVVCYLEHDFEMCPISCDVRCSLHQRLCKLTRLVQKIRGLFELRGSSWFQENPLDFARFVQISWIKRRFPVADIVICW